MFVLHMETTEKTSEFPIVWQNMAITSHCLFPPSISDPEYDIESFFEILKLKRINKPHQDVCSETSVKLKN